MYWQFFFQLFSLEEVIDINVYLISCWLLANYHYRCRVCCGRNVFSEVCKKVWLTLTLTDLVTACLFSRISVTAMKSCCIFSYKPTTFKFMCQACNSACLSVIGFFRTSLRSMGENPSLMIIQKILSKYFMLIMNQKSRAFTESLSYEDIVQISNFKLHYQYQYASYTFLSGYFMDLLWLHKKVIWFSWNYNLENLAVCRNYIHDLIVLLAVEIPDSHSSTT